MNENYSRSIHGIPSLQGTAMPTNIFDILLRSILRRTTTMTSQSFPALFYIINHWNAFQTKYCISATLYEVYIFFDGALVRFYLFVLYSVTWLHIKHLYHSATLDTSMNTSLLKDDRISVKPFARVPPLGDLPGILPTRSVWRALTFLRDVW